MMSIYKLGGTPLSDEEFKKIIKEITRPNAKYLMSAGQAYSVFFEGLRRGKIIGTYCERCGMIYVPPKIFCPYCFITLDKWVEVADEGKVVTAVASYYSANMERLKEPQIVGIIKLDVPGRTFTSYRFPGLLHRICGASLDDVISQRIFDARVKARWRPSEERKGDINDIECFEVIKT
jgi:uncharacterized OB-fold protein